MASLLLSPLRGVVSTAVVARRKRVPGVLEAFFMVFLDLPATMKLGDILWLIRGPAGG